MGKMSSPYSKREAGEMRNIESIPLGLEDMKEEEGKSDSGAADFCCFLRDVAGARYLVTLPPVHACQIEFQTKYFRRCLALGQN